jgi:hypothetical protein
MRMLTSLTLFALSSVAMADTYELNLNSAFQGTTDVDFDILSFSRHRPAFGIDGGMTVAKNTNLLVGLHTGTVGTTVYTGEDSEYDSMGNWAGEGSFQIASTVNQLKIGARHRHDLGHSINATLTAQGIFAHANLRMDEDIEMEGSEVAVHYNAFAPGFTAAVGMEWKPKLLKVGPTAGHLGAEAGYGHIFAFNFKDRDRSDEPISVGSLNLNGTLLRVYVGTEF